MIRCLEYQSLIKDFLLKMTDHKNFESTIEKCADWDRYYLQGGYPAIIIFMLTIKDYINYDEWNISFKHYFNRFYDDLEQSYKVFESQGFENFGYIGLGYTWLELSKAGFGESELVKINNRIKYYSKYNIKIANENLKNGKVEISNYDAIDGLVLTLRYMLNFSEYGTFKEEIQQIITYLIELSTDERGKAKYWIKAENIHNPILSEICKVEILDCGVAHGIAGIINVLAIAKIKGINNEGLDSAISRLLVELETKTINKENIIYWPTIVMGHEQNKNLNDNANYSWCYGVIGIARAFYLGGKALKNDSYIELANKAFKSIILNVENITFNSSGLCHGYSSIVYLSKIMFNDTKDEFYNGIAKKFLPKVIENVGKFNIPESENNYISIFEGVLGDLITIVLYDNEKESIITQQLICN